MNLFTHQLFFPYLSAKVFLLQTEGKHCNLKSPFCFVLNTIFGNLGGVMDLSTTTIETSLLTFHKNFSSATLWPVELLHQ